MDDEMVSHIEQLVGTPAFRAWCLGKGSWKNTLYWDQWMATDIYHLRVGRIARQIVLELEKRREDLPPGKKVVEWRKIAQRLRAETGSPGFKPTPKRGRTLRSGWGYTIAASVLLVVISFSVLRVTNFIPTAQSTEQRIDVPEAKTISTAYGEQKIIQLQSGTRITLNANSTITYRDGWVYQNSVNIQLTGEAYFEVRRRESPAEPVFRVETSDGNIEVLGTRFMVSTRDQKTRVVLEEGQVAIERKSGKKNGNAILNPDQLAEFSRRAGDISINRVNTALYTSWVKGLFVFEHTPLMEVAHLLTQTFGTNVEIVDPVLLTREVSGSIEITDLDLVISALGKVMQIPISRQDGTVIIGKPLFESVYNKQSAN